MKLAGRLPTRDLNVWHKNMAIWAIAMETLSHDRLEAKFRDLDAHPYSADERRVGEFLDMLTNGDLGWGNDPIGFLLASYRVLIFPHPLPQRVE